MGPDAVLNSFLQTYLADQAKGMPRSTREYQALFPGYEDLIARETELLESGEDAAAVNDTAPWVGTGGERRTLGPYLLLDLLGKGGQGIVYRAVDQRLKRPVALKLLTEHAALSTDALERFQRESLIASRLDDSGVCPVYEAGTLAGTPFIAMRFVAGRTLATLLDEARRNSSSPWLQLEGTAGSANSSLHDVVALIERVANSLHRAHEAGITHRDIKPANIMVTADGPVLLDFGVARIQDDELRSITQSGDLVGTPVYMSPEQITGDGARLDRRTDVYSLAVTLYECLTLHRPFEAPTREALFHQICTADAPDTRRFHSELPEDLRVILTVALEKDRDRRYQTARDLADDLRRWRTSEPIRVRRATRIYQLRKFARRHRIAVGAAVAVFAALLLGVIGTSLAMFKARRAQGEALELATKEREQRAQVEQQVKRVSAVMEFLQGMLHSPSPYARGRDVTMRDVVIAAAADLETSFPQDEEVRGHLHRVLGTSLRELGDLEHSEHHLAAALEIATRLFGERDQRSVEAVRELGALNSAQGQLGEAETLFRRALEIGGSLGMPADWMVATRNGLVALLGRQGRIDEAAKLSEETLSFALATLGETHLFTLSAMNNAAQVADRRNDLQAAEDLHRRTLAIRKRVLPEQHPSILVSMDGLALALHRMQRCDEAEMLYRQALAGFQRTMSERHVETLRCSKMLAECLAGSGKVEEAEALLRRTLAIAEEELEPEGADTLELRLALAELLNAGKRFAEAEPIWREGLDLAKNAKLTTMTRSMARGWAHCLAEQHRFEDAEAELLQLHGDHPDWPWTRDELIRLYQAWGKPGRIAGLPKSGG